MDPGEQLALLRRFEPQLRFTRGELFHPMSVEDYVAGCALVDDGASPAEQLAARGTLTLARLADLGRGFPDRRLSLNHVERSLDRRAYRAWRQRADRERFDASSRFAAVGLLGRLTDGVLRLTLLVRGRVPGGFAAAASEAYARTARRDEPHYYGHVTEDAGYTVVQYWYFYAMNDWRSTFGGVNDHEADWEQVTLFLVADPAAADGLRPQWVAFSSHDEVGDDLRRRWDDPDLTWVGEHPVVHVGAGSHSGALLPGEYLVTAPVPLPGWARRAARRLGGDGAGLRIPYLDYKRGDGARIGAAAPLPWTAVLLEDTTPWVRDYRGLWGLDTSDPFGGERAPAGPRYERGGAVRRAWAQPVAWAGLDKVAPTGGPAPEQLAATRDRLRTRLVDVEQHLAATREDLRGAHAAERTLGRSPLRPGRLVGELTDQVAQLREQQAQLGALGDALERAGPGPVPEEAVHAHLRRRALPLDRAGRAPGRLLRAWAAASASLLLAALGVLLLSGAASLAATLSLAGVMLGVEALLRRRLFVLAVSAVAVAAGFVVVLSAVSIVLGNLRLGFGVLLLLAAGYLAVTTLGEVLRRR